MSKFQSKFFVDPLYSRMSDDLHLTGKSERTHQGYLRAVRQLAEYCKRSPDKITETQLRRYFLYLKNEKKFATGSMRVAYSGIKFFYSISCQRDWDTLKKMKIQIVHTLPEVLTIPQVHRIIDACTTERIAVYFWTVYSMGLRLEEGLNLQVGDVDAARGLVHIHRGKGAKDRYVPLPSATLQLLRLFWRTHQHPRLLFPADGRKHTGMSTAKTPMSPTAVQGAMKLITNQINFGKKVSIHTLRQAYS
jgi:site-specific recombinase XerD